jgi:hypothetical protein
MKNEIAELMDRCLRKTEALLASVRDYRSDIARGRVKPPGKREEALRGLDRMEDGLVKLREGYRL